MKPISMMSVYMIPSNLGIKPHSCTFSLSLEMFNFWPSLITCLGANLWISKEQRFPWVWHGKALRYKPSANECYYFTSYLRGGLVMVIVIRPSSIEGLKLGRFWCPLMRPTPHIFPESLNKLANGQDGGSWWHLVSDPAINIHVWSFLPGDLRN